MGLRASEYREELPGVDRAELQVRRQAARGVGPWHVAEAVVVVERPVPEPAGRSLGRGLAGDGKRRVARRFLRNADALGDLDPAHRGRCPQRRVPSDRSPRSQEGREHLVRIASRIEHRARRHRVRAPDQAKLDIRIGELSLHKVVVGRAVRAEVGGGIHPLRTRFSGDRGHDLTRRTTAHDKLSADRLVESPKAPVQEHLSRRTRRPHEGIVEAEQRHDALAAARVGHPLHQRRVVRQSQVPAKPHHRRRHRDLLIRIPAGWSPPSWSDAPALIVGSHLSSW